jgi:hypothetical protein
MNIKNFIDRVEYELLKLDMVESFLFSVVIILLSSAIVQLLIFLYQKV